MQTSEIQFPDRTARSSQQNAQPPALAELPGGSPPEITSRAPDEPDDPDWSG